MTALSIRDWTRRIALTLAVSAAGAGFSVHAQDAGGSSPDRQELQSLQQSLASIREEAIEENPELADRQQSLEDRMMSRMRDEGVNPREDVRRLQDIARELRGGEVAEEERAGMMQEYQQTRQSLLQARRSAMQDSDIQQDQTALQEDIVSAMTAIDDGVPDMIDRFERLRGQVQQQRQPGSGGGAGNSSQ
jgi:preprotein translocase subunit SecD